MSKKLKPNAIVRVNTSLDGSVGIAIFPQSMALGLSLGRAHLVAEETKTGKNVYVGAFGPCAEDEFDAPVSFVSINFEPTSKRGKKLLQRLKDASEPETSE